jgi:KaiC/GvpD/RAD55 family RecA-like ATPase
MIKAELIKRSPLRVLEKTTRGALSKGSLGIVAAKKGTGKTAFLVHLATDQLFQGRHVIHVSYAGKTDHIIDWYEEIFEEIAERYRLDGPREAHDQVVRNRVIMNFNQTAVTVTQVTRSVSAMIRDGHFDADLVVVDGFDFRKGSPAEIEEFHTFAREMGLAIWFSATLPLEEDVPPGLPPLLERYSSVVDIVLVLRPQANHLRLELVKDHDRSVADTLALELDPKILLILEQPA